MELIVESLLWFILAILFLNLAYMAIFGLAGLFYPKEQFPTIAPKIKFAIFIPAYKGDEVILNTARETLKQDYPKDKFDVIVIADSLQEQTLKELGEMPLKVVEVAFENSTKGKSLNAAIKAVEGTHYEYAIILDIDNIVEDGFLEKMNSALQGKQLVLQAHRLAKNEDTKFSILDGVSEEINNHIFRKGHKVLGLSAALIGSGKALEYNFFVEIMSQITAVGGFDKQMEVLIISRKVRIDYAHDILVYDEKVQKPEVFQNQRKRWMSAQLTFMKQYAFKGIMKAITTGNLDLFDKSIQLVLLPRLINLGLNMFFCLSWFINPAIGMYAVYLLLLQMVFLIICTPQKYYNAQTLQALMSLPQGFVLMFLNIFKLKGANKKFIHTPHSVSQPEKNRKET